MFLKFFKLKFGERRTGKGNIMPVDCTTFRVWKGAFGREDVFASRRRAHRCFLPLAPGRSSRSGSHRLSMSWRTAPPSTAVATMSSFDTWHASANFRFACLCALCALCVSCVSERGRERRRREGLAPGMQAGCSFARASTSSCRRWPARGQSRGRAGARLPTAQALQRRRAESRCRTSPLIWAPTSTFGSGCRRDTCLGTTLAPP